jgi:hypothetical protein
MCRMLSRRLFSYALRIASVVGLLVLQANSQANSQESQHPAVESPVNKVFKIVSPEELLTRPMLVRDHALAPALDLALQRYTYIRNNVSDYTCTLVKREQVNGTLREYEHIYIKVRRGRTKNTKVKPPISIYMKYLSPKALRGREVLYVTDENNGDALVRNGGRRASYLEVWLDPHGDLAMRDNRYPITEFGIENLLARLIQVAQEEMQHGECEVNIFDNAKLDGRSCTAIEVRHPVRRDYFLYHVARILLDNSSQLPVHYAAYTWPDSPGESPRLLEEYTYRNLQINVGLSDEDFSRENTKYGFRKN